MTWAGLNHVPAVGNDEHLKAGALMGAGRRWWGTVGEEHLVATAQHPELPGASAIPLHFTLDRLKKGAKRRNETFLSFVHLIVRAPGFHQRN